MCLRRYLIQGEIFSLLCSEGPQEFVVVGYQNGMVLLVDHTSGDILHRLQVLSCYKLLLLHLFSTSRIHTLTLIYTLTHSLTHTLSFLHTRALAHGVCHGLRLLNTLTKNRDTWTKFTAYVGNHCTARPAKSLRPQNKVQQEE